MEKTGKQEDLERREEWRKQQTKEVKKIKDEKVVTK